MEPEAKVGDNKEAGKGNVDETSPSPDHNPDGGPSVATSKSTKAPAFQFYPKDFLTSPKVRRMSMTARGVYITLLCECWLETSLPDDLGELAFEVGMAVKPFSKLWLNSPLHTCFVVKNGRLVNERLDTERKKQAEYRRRQADFGKKGGRPKGSLVEEKGLPLPTPKGSQSPREQSSSSSSPISDLRSSTAVGGTRTPRPTSIVTKRNPRAAWEGARSLYVLHEQHARFVGFRGPGSDAELFTFYDEIAESYAGNIEPDMFKFWNSRYAERYPSAPVASRDNSPAWMKAAKARS